MGLAGLAQETLEIVARGAYLTPSGNTVSIASEVSYAVSNTALYRPEELAVLVSRPGRGGARPKIEVVAETTAMGARRLSAEGTRVVALNFASAKNPGGGFLGGAKAQEEDLARCSALYTCQLTQREYYDANRSYESLLYTDHLIYSPDVPFFRDDKLELLEKPFLASVITSPAPNAGEVLNRKKNARPAIRAALERRAAMVLAVAEERGHRVLVLGAWGCGVFRNDPAEVAAVFAAHLESPRFSGAFDHVAFSIWDSTKTRAVLTAFQSQFRERSSDPQRTPHNP
jgi:uncharacterized protein (TIGR02452 family)